MRVGVLCKRDKPEAIAVARQLCAWLVEGGHVAALVRVDDRGGVDLPGATVVDEGELPDQIELLVVLGGDGTLLHGAALVSDHGIPILGINLGNLGFLTSSPFEGWRATMELALAGKLPLERRMRLRVVLRRAGGEELVRYACNDAVLSQASLARLLELEAHLDGKLITTYQADGLIIATPTGSTAYSLAAGGPIISPDVQAMVVTPICPHMLTNRPLVVPSASRLQVALGRHARDVVVTVDGKWGVAFERDDVVEIHAANKPMLLCRPADFSHFEILRAKLHWGERSRP